MTSQTLEWAQTIRRAVPGLEHDRSVDCYWLTGSIPAGLGTPTSDLDLIVIADPAAATTSGQYDVDGRRVDVTVYPLTWLTDAVAAVVPYRATTGDNSQLFTREPVLKAVSQVYAGIEVVKDSPEFVRAREELAAGAVEFRRLLIARDAMYANNTYEDLAGFVRDGDVESALARARDLLEFGLSAWCVARGEVYPGTKWLWRKLRRTVTDLAAIRAAYLPETTGTVADLRSVHAAHALTQTLLGQALLLSWSKSPAARLEPEVSDAAAEGLWRTPDHMPMRFADVWCLSGGPDLLTVPFTAVVCWTFANGVPAEDLVTRVVDYCRDQFRIAVSRPTIRSLVERLTEMGVLAAGTVESLAKEWGAA
jgi:hypothetical protein